MGVVFTAADGFIVTPCKTAAAACVVVRDQTDIFILDQSAVERFAVVHDIEVDIVRMKDRALVQVLRDLTVVPQQEGFSAVGADHGGNTHAVFDITAAKQFAAAAYGVFAAEGKIQEIMVGIEQPCQVNDTFGNGRMRKLFCEQQFFFKTAADFFRIGMKEIVLSFRK